MHFNDTNITRTCKYRYRYNISNTFYFYRRANASIYSTFPCIVISRWWWRTEGYKQLHHWSQTNRQPCRFDLLYILHTILTNLFLFNSPERYNPLLPHIIFVHVKQALIYYINCLHSGLSHSLVLPSLLLVAPCGIISVL